MAPPPPRSPARAGRGGRHRPRNYAARVRTMRPAARTAEPAPVDGDGALEPAVDGTERLAPERPPRSLAGRAADYLTLLGMFAAPLYGKGIGGITGIAYADIILGFAALARGVDLISAGIRIQTIRRHSFLLGTMGLFAVFGLISGFANHTNPIAWGFIRVVIATLGGVILIATYGDQGKQARRELLLAFAFGCIVLSLSSFTGLKLAGRSLGWSVHPNALGHSEMMGLAASVWLWDNTKRPLFRWFWVGAVGLDLLAIMNSGSRGGLLGIMVAVALYLALRGNRRLTLLAIFGTFMMALILAVGIVRLPPTNPLARLLQQGSSASQTATASDQQRQELLKEDVARIDASPYWGDGFDDIVNVHVAYLQGWVAAGAVAGLITMIVGLAMFLLPFITPRKDLALACGAAAVATAWVFTNIFTARDQWLYLAITFASAGPISVLGHRREALAEIEADA